MPNEKITGNPAEKPAEKVSENGAGKPAGRCDGRRGRPQGGQQNRPQGDREGGQSARSPRGRRNVQPDNPQGGSQSGRPAGSSGRSGSSRPVAGTAVGKPAFNWTWRDYALQLSVVIIGIVVTFAGSGLISRWARYFAIGKRNYICPSKETSWGTAIIRRKTWNGSKRSRA